MKILQLQNERIQKKSERKLNMNMIGDELLMLGVSKQKISQIYLTNIQRMEERIRELEEENRKLNENIKWYEKEEDRLRERIRFLEQCLDNKEKVNKQLREDIGKLVMNNPSQFRLVYENKRYKKV